MDVYLAGHFGKPHGVKGEVNACLHDGEALQAGSFVFVKIDGLLVPWEVENCRQKGDDWLLKLVSLDTVEELKYIVNQPLFLPGAQEEEMDEKSLDDEEEIYIEDLIGYTVVNSETDEAIGILDDYDERTQNALFVIKDKEGKPLLVPAVDDFVTFIDHSNHILGLSIPKELLELN